jgi:hypothetical protein
MDEQSLRRRDKEPSIKSARELSYDRFMIRDERLMNKLKGSFTQPKLITSTWYTVIDTS